MHTGRYALPASARNHLLLRILRSKRSHGFRLRRLHRQLQATAVVGFQHLDADLLAFLQVIGNGIDTLVGDLADVQQTILAGQNLNDRAKVQQFQHGAFIDLADFHTGGQFFDTTPGFLTGGGIDGSDGDHTIVTDVDLGAGFFGKRADDGAAFADHITDFFLTDPDGDQAWRKIRQFSLAGGNGFLHLAKDMDTTFPGLLQRNLRAFPGYALYLD